MFAIGVTVHLSRLFNATTFELKMSFNVIELSVCFVCKIRLASFSYLCLSLHKWEMSLTEFGDITCFLTKFAKIAVHWSLTIIILSFPSSVFDLCIKVLFFFSFLSDAVCLLKTFLVYFLSIWTSCDLKVYSVHHQLLKVWYSKKYDDNLWQNLMKKKQQTDKSIELMFNVILTWHGNRKIILHMIPVYSSK